MLITRETDYGIRIIRGLADVNKLTVSEICKKEQIPASFAYKILKKLNKNGLVLVLRGATGGYKLAKQPDEITLLDIMLAIEDGVILNKCQANGYKCEYVECTGQACKVYKELDRIQKIVKEELSRFTLKEILQRD